jgi:tRNA uridine 5-carbamoylmethylation protein Kti12
MKVINLFAEPSAGKSTTAAGLFFLMKKQRMNVELISEYAKQCVWESRKKTLDDQLYVTAKQNHKQQVLLGQVDYVITDSPLILGIVYSRYSARYPSFHKLVAEVFNSYDNFNVFIKRTKPYNPIGRIQSETEAQTVRVLLQRIMDELGIKYHQIDGDDLAPQKILSLLTQEQASPIMES